MKVAQGKRRDGCKIKYASGRDGEERRRRREERSRRSEQLLEVFVQAPLLSISAIESDLSKTFGMPPAQVGVACSCRFDE